MTKHLEDNGLAISLIFSGLLLAVLGLLSGGTTTLGQGVAIGTSNPNNAVNLGIVFIVVGVVVRVLDAKLQKQIVRTK